MKELKYKDAYIKVVPNGFIIEIGCQRLVAETPKSLLALITRYLKDPIKTEAEIMGRLERGATLNEIPPAGSSITFRRYPGAVEDVRGVAIHEGNYDLDKKMEETAKAAEKNEIFWQERRTAMAEQYNKMVDDVKEAVKRAEEGPEVKQRVKNAEREEPENNG